MKTFYAILSALCFSQITFAQITLTTNFASTTICAGNSVAINANASPGGNIIYTWSPSTGLNTTEGSSVIATPENTTTYTVTATNLTTSATASRMVTVNINENSHSLAGDAGGSSVCQSIIILPAGSVYRGNDCKMIAGVTPSGLNPVSGIINTCVKIESQPTRMGSLNLLVARHYDIEPQSNASNATATVTLYFLQKEFDDYNAKAEDSGLSKLPSTADDDYGITNLIVRQYHGTGTLPNNYTGAAQDFNYTNAGVVIEYNKKSDMWEITLPVSGFSGFYITSKKGALNALPVKMEYFKGTQVNKKNILIWKANCSSGGVTFTIQRSTNNFEYTDLQKIIADETRCNSPFEVTDADPADGKNYYRIKLTDINGKTGYSNTIQLNSKNKAFDMIMTPNVVTEDATLTVNSSEVSEMIVVISDVSGRKLQHQTLKIRQGKNVTKLSTGKLSGGVYLLSAYIPGTDTQTLRFIKK